MKVRELIEALQTFAPDLEVATGGFDGYGIETIGQPEVIRVRFKRTADGAISLDYGHLSPHEEVNEGDADQGEEVVIIDRE